MFRGRVFRVTDCGGGPIEKGGGTKIPSACSWILTISTIHCSRCQ